MTDSRFFTNAGPFSADALAAAVSARLIKNGKELVGCQDVFHDVAPLQTAVSRDISFLDNPKYADYFATSHAGACLVHEKYVARAPASMLLLVCEEPYVAYAQIAAMFFPTLAASTKISPHAHISHDAVLGEHVSVGAGAIIEEGAKIGSHSSIAANVFIGRNVQIGEYVSIGANSTVTHSLIGNHVLIHRGVHIGQDGFGFAPGATGVVKVPQLGRVLIEDHVEIGSGTCIDRGAAPDTIIGAYTKIDNLVQIGHNVQLGKFCFLAGQVGIAGSTVIGDGVMLGGQVGVAGHLHIGKGAKIAAKSGVMHDIPVGQTHIGVPSMPNKEFFRQLATLKKLTQKGKHDE